MSDLVPFNRMLCALLISQLEREVEQFRCGAVRVTQREGMGPDWRDETHIWFQRAQDRLDGLRTMLQDAHDGDAHRP